MVEHADALLGILSDCRDHLGRLARAVASRGPHGVLRTTRGVEDSVSVAGFVLNPGAGTEIVSTGPLDRGVYEVYTITRRVGTDDGTHNNFALMRGSQQLCLLLAAGVSNNTNSGPRRITLDGNQPLRIVNVAAAGAGMNYIAEILATRIE